jgi:hypothetical protein
MPRIGLVLLFMVAMSLSHGQALVVNGTVSGGSKVQEDVLIDIYEYNSPIQTLHTDAKGYFTFRLDKGKEYLVVIYKSGFVSQSFSFGDSRNNPITTYSLTISLEIDDRSPDGLYFKAPARRITPDVTDRYFLESKFSLHLIKPQKKADSILVLLNRAQANQYILVGNMKLGANTADTKYSRQVEGNIQNEIAGYKAKLLQNMSLYDSLALLESKHQKATMTTTGDTQLNEVIEAQRLLAERLTATSEHYLLEQQQMLSQARLDEMAALRHEQELSVAKDSVKIRMIKTAIQKSKYLAVNDRYLAMDANRKLQLYNKYQVLSYQEYIELLRYRDKKKDTANADERPSPAKVKSSPPATISPIDTSDNLSKMTDVQRTKLIQQALEEEQRFKNYTEKTGQKRINGYDVTVKNIHIADDDYEMQVDKKGNTKYIKNGKPVTKLTFEFETVRKMADVLNTIRQVDRFGK